MIFEVEKAVEILERTPKVLKTMLYDVSGEWTMENEGENTWSPFDIVGHLIHCEEADWMLRAEIILSNGNDVIWEPFDRFAQFEKSKGKNLNQLLNEFYLLRKKNIEKLISKNLSKIDYEKLGVHPSFGNVKLSQLLSSWVAHDLNHIAQISRVMAFQYKTEVGPWKAYMGIYR